MTIKTFIQEELLNCLKPNAVEVLVVYDPDRRYRELCLELATEQRRVIDASASSIESREAALAAFQQLGHPNPPITSLIIYVPAPPPLSDEAKQRDPFALYGECGATFPAGDGDKYFNLCLKAKADYATEIRRIFDENPHPDFAVINAVGAGGGWPQLQALLRVESARDLLFAILAPSEKQRAALLSHNTWVEEAKALSYTALGCRLTTRIASRDAIAGELWRFLLFSEFAFDLPGALPPALGDVPRAGPAARPLVTHLCERLRNDQRAQVRYIEQAEGIEQDLNLPKHCQGIADLGQRVTFPFEERVGLAQAIDALKRDNPDQVREIIDRHTYSVWVGRGESQSEWLLLQSVKSLIEACDTLERQLPDHIRSQQTLIDFYVFSLRDVDRYQREMEQAFGEIISAQAPLMEIVDLARRKYRQLTTQVQEVFIKHLESSGWPPPDQLANADVFDHCIAPMLLESGRRIAMLLIDALRYELGVELQKKLTEEGQISLRPAFAYLPSITPVGMSSLLPGAGNELRLGHSNNRLVPHLGEHALRDVNQRMKVLQRLYGQRFTEAPLLDFARGAVDVPNSVELLVLRSNEMDQAFESNPDAAPGFINRTFRQIRTAMHKLRATGFQDVFIVTDHGFYFNATTGAGDVCAKPPGHWLNIHERMLLGDGTADVDNFVLPADALGIRGDFNQVAGPRTMVAYRSGEMYFHGGISLQEAIVPVIALRLRAIPQAVVQQPLVTLKYKRDSRRITTHLPVFEIAVGLGDIFSASSMVEILLEAQDTEGNVVGEAKTGGLVSPATRTVSLKPGDTEKITLRMDLRFEGKFTVKALDPTTQTILSQLEMETDYTV